MALKRSFRNIQILLADSDTTMARVVLHQLHAMGFTQVKHVWNGRQAMQALRSRRIDILITEWIMSPVNGLELIQKVRKNPDSPNRTMPIIMLTGRGEAADVKKARDIGITEFVVKPFTSQTLYRRIEQVIEHPRSFIISNGYVGPERRRRGKLPDGVKERRSVKPKTITKGEAAHIQSMDAPKVVMPDHSLKESLGIYQPLKHVITDDVLREAQHAITQMVDDSLDWIRPDLMELEHAFERLNNGAGQDAVEQAKQAALSIKSRAGTFSYTLASEVARLLYLFLCSEYTPGRPMHVIVIEKHIEVLKVIVATELKEDERLGQELLSELNRLADMD